MNVTNRRMGTMAGINWNSVPDLYTASTKELAIRLNVSTTAVRSARHARSARADHPHFVNRKNSVPSTQSSVKVHPEKAPTAQNLAKAKESVTVNNPIKDLECQIRQKAMKLCSTMKPAEMKQAADLLETFEKIANSVRHSLQRLHELSA